MDQAVRVAKELTNDEDTLIIVTADHSHSMTSSGYTSRGNDILGTRALLEFNSLRALLLIYVINKTTRVFIIIYRLSQAYYQARMGTFLKHHNYELLVPFVNLRGLIYKSVFLRNRRNNHYCGNLDYI